MSDANKKVINAVMYVGMVGVALSLLLGICRVIDRLHDGRTAESRLEYVLIMHEELIARHGITLRDLAAVTDKGAELESGAPSQEGGHRIECRPIPESNGWVFRKAVVTPCVGKR